mmetsp:Transcript_42668/g.126577  ORF Transcript_42668/g.126577 Transcript_42668/m.126577 type:complete len:297 (+) Transcript_42668:30-920(+)
MLWLPPRPPPRGPPRGSPRGGAQQEASPSGRWGGRQADSVFCCMRREAPEEVPDQDRPQPWRTMPLLGPFCCIRRSREEEEALRSPRPQSKPHWPPPVTPPQVTPRNSRPTTPRERDVDVDLNRMMEGFNSLNSVVADLQREMARMKREMKDMEQKNAKLSEENKNLQQNQREESPDPWSNLDVMEDHYRHLDRQRQLREQPDPEDVPVPPFTDGDQAAGLSAAQGSASLTGLTGLNYVPDESTTDASAEEVEDGVRTPELGQSPKKRVDVPRLNLAAANSVSQLSNFPGVSLTSS